MKKTIISLLLALCMVVCLTAFTASAEETATVEAHPHDDANYAHCVCGNSAVGVGDHTTCTDVEWVAMSQALSDIGLTATTANIGELPSGNYYLDCDITIKSTSTIGSVTAIKKTNENGEYLDKDGNVVTKSSDALTIGHTFDHKKDIAICLNGYNISTSANRVFGGLYRNSSLTICDCSGAKDAEGNWTWGGTITAGSKTATNGGIIYTYAGSVMNIYGGNIAGSSLTHTNGGLFVVACDSCGDLDGDGDYDSTDMNSEGARSYLNIYNGYLYGGKANNAGNIVQWHASVLNMYGGTITGGEATTSNGGNIGASHATTKTNIYGGTISNGKAYGRGGNIYVRILEMSGGTITGGTATSYNTSTKKTDGAYGGGNIHFLNGADATISGGTISDGISKAGGANIQIVGTSTLTITGGTVSGGTVAKGYNGGSIRVNNSGSTLNIGTAGETTGPQIIGGAVTGSSNGGNIYCVGNLNVYSGTISGGTSETNGGNINISSSGTLKITGGTISGGSAKSGGGNIYSAGDTEISGGTVSGGRAYVSGGNIYQINAADRTLTITGTAQIKDGHAQADDTGTVDTDYTSSNLGGNIYVHGVNDSEVGHMEITGGTISGGYANCGGNVYSNGTVEISDGTISDGYAKGSGSCGGNLYLGMVRDTTTKEIYPTVTMTGGTISGGNAANGGNLQIHGNFTMYGGTISGGTATGGGATVRVFRPGSFVLDGGTVIGGTTNSYGGAFQLSGHTVTTSYKQTATLTVKSGTITGGTAKNGGAIHVAIFGELIVEDGTITGGTATTDGGNIYIANSSYTDRTISVNISGGTISGGTAAGKGGNICAAKCVGETTIQITGGTISGGTSTGSQGGNIHNMTTMTISGATIENGTSKTAGGNLYNEGTLTLSNTSFSNGTSQTTQGGNIYTGTALTIENCTFTGGSAATNGGSISAAKALTLNNVTITGGTAQQNGGAVYAASTLTVNGGTISGGSATHGGNLYMDKGTNEIKNATISGGKANLMADGNTNGNGGNILCASGATTTITGCTITGGEARRAGSVGVWGKVTIEDTSITGGYAYYDGGNIMVYGNGQMTLNADVTLSGGEAGSSGGAIAMHANAGKISTINSGVVISDGTAGNKNAQGIYVNGGTLVLNGTPSITSIKVNNSSASYGMTVTDYTGEVINLYGGVAGDFAASDIDQTARFVNDQGFVVAYRGGYMYLDAPTAVYVSNAGSDDNSGTETAPFATVEHAMDMVANDGTIHLLNAVELATWDQHEKGFTITGGELVLPETRVNVNDHVTFDNLTITMPMCTTTTSSNLGHYFFYCDGFTTVFEEDVTIRYLYNGTYMTDPYHEVTYTKSDGTTVTNKAKSFLYGGCNSSYENTYGAIDGTDLTVLSGIWGNIFGGNNGVDLDGDVHLTVGGVVNEGVDYISHTRSGECIILGGSRAADINGTVYMNVTGGNYHTSTHGGSSGDCYVENIELRVTGGNGMALYGAGRHGSLTTGTVNVYYEGGTFEQVFGGTLMGNLTGDINLYVTGGNITRRLYGGCYTECQESSLKWEDDNGNAIDYFTTGNVNLIIGSGANISCDLKQPDSIIKYNDRGIYGHSRREAPSSTDAENATIIFLDKAAYDENAGNLTAQDLAMSIIMNGVSAADLICYLGWSADDTADVIYANATAVADPETGVTGDASAISATASMTLAEGPFYYTGSAHEPATATVSDNWLYGEVTPVYANNTEIGTATASITANGYTVSNTFEIVKKDDVAQVVVGDTVTAYGWLQDAVNAVSDGGYLKMLSGCDEDVTVSKDLYLDLNGFSLTGTVTVEDGCTLYGMDSSTNDYDCSDGYGEIKSVVGTVALHHKTDVTGRILRYLTYTDAETGAVSFHRIYLGITHMSLRPSVVGVGYKAAFRADEKAQSMLNETEAFGYKLWITNDEGVIGSTAALYKGIREFKNDGYVTLRLEGFPVEQYGETQVWAEVYLKLNDEAGTVIDSSDYVMTLREMLEAINENVDAYSATQMAAIQAMCEPYVEFMQTNNWSVANILAWTAPTA